MQTREIIIQVGAEGGNLTLYGTRTDQGWNFSLDVNDLTAELIDGSAIQHTVHSGSPWVHALKFMDRYPWHKLYPLEVHTDFRIAVLDEVRLRFKMEGSEAPWNASEWEKICLPSVFNQPKNTKNKMPNNSTISSYEAGLKNDPLQLNIVYVLSNPAMPGYIKIGHTKQSDAQLRIDQLYTTGVPVPFDLEYACKVHNAEEVEKALHIAFGPARVNPKREFFKIDTEQAIAILKLLHTEDATKEVESQPSSVDAASVNASAQLKAKRPNMNFEEMGIPIGSVLQSIHGNLTASVCGPKKVLFADEEMSLTAATKQVLGIEHSIQPSPHWTYQGKLLKAIYEETYSTDE